VWSDGNAVRINSIGSQLFPFCHAMAPIGTRGAAVAGGTKADLQEKKRLIRSMLKACASRRRHSSYRQLSVLI
jgi:hypothetical protein